MPNLSREEKLELIVLLEEKKRREMKFRYRKLFDSMYEWQREFIAKTASYSEVCLCAANRIGKTYTGTYIDAIHAMGDYPDDWPGHKFEHPPLIWCLGYSGEKTRDLLQNEIFGVKTGMMKGSKVTDKGKRADKKSSQRTRGTRRKGK